MTSTLFQFSQSHFSAFHSGGPTFHSTMNGPSGDRSTSVAPTTLSGPRIGSMTPLILSHALSAFSFSQSRTPPPASHARPNCFLIQSHAVAKPSRIGFVLSQIHLAVLSIHSHAAPAAFLMRSQTGAPSVSQTLLRNPPMAEATVRRFSIAEPAIDLAKSPAA